MTVKFCHHFVICGFTMMGLFLALDCFATLGERDSSVDNDLAQAQQMHGMRRANQTRERYTVHQIDTDAGSIREYSDKNTNLVFGIAWDGYSPPNLDQLLGSFADEYNRGLDETPKEKGKRIHELKTHHIIVQKWGHMRNLRGRAYSPTLMPAGVNPNDIQ